MRPTKEQVDGALELAIPAANSAYEVLVAEVRALREELAAEKREKLSWMSSSGTYCATLGRVGELPNMWRGEWEESGHDYEHFSCLNCADQLETVLKRTP